MNYEDFIKSKQHTGSEYGIEPNFIPDCLFDFQKYISEKAIKKGRLAGFIDTGLGKTLIELVVAKNYVKHTNKPVLIITPLAVAFQFIKEAEKFGIDDVAYSRDGSLNSKIVLCNYERLSKFNSNNFDCVILDESSILKNFQGKIKNQITYFLKNIKYRYLFTATPSPNDFTELGTSSEALGYMGYTDMLSKFFRNNEDTISPQNIGTNWVLKSHAVNDFFYWVSSWSLSMRKPSDLGFSDEKFILPELITNHNSIINKNNLMDGDQFTFFNKIARTRTEIAQENRLTLTERCEKAVELSGKYKNTVYWCNLNNESDLIEKLDNNAVQIKGSMKLEKKEEILNAFSNKEISNLITKPKITSFGLNWQHCNHTVYFPTFSYEQYYQAIRRFWRFGQTNKVIADIVFSNGQKRVIDSLFAKSKKADKLFSELNMSINKTYIDIKKDFNKETILPKFLG